MGAMEPEASSSTPTDDPNDFLRMDQDVSSSSSLPGRPAASSSSSRPTPPAPARGGGRRSLDSSTGAGRRMFGLLNQTLSKANAENARGIQAANRRAEIEARQKKALEKRAERLEANKRLRTELQSAKMDVVELACDIAQQDALVRVRKAQKRRMASFLVAVPDGSRALLKDRGPQGRSRDRGSSENERVIAPRVPLVLGPARIAPPVYYLPKKMLDAQDDMMDAQEDDVDDELEIADSEWTAKKSEMVEELRKKKANVQRLSKEVKEAEQEEGIEKGEGDVTMQEANGGGKTKKTEEDNKQHTENDEDEAMVEK